MHQGSGRFEDRRNSDHQSSPSFENASLPASEGENPYQSPGSEDRFRDLVGPLSEVIESIHRVLKEREMSLEEYYDSALEVLEGQGIVAMDLSESEAVMKVEQILAKCRRWLPLDKKLGRFELGLKQDYVCLPGVQPGHEFREDLQDYQELVDRLVGELQEEFPSAVVTKEVFLEKIEYALTIQMSLSEERQFALQRRLQTDLQSELRVVPPVGRYFGELLRLPVSPAEFHENVFRGAGTKEIYTSEDFSQAIEMLAIGRSRK